MFSSFVFASPWLLGFLATLPVLWWLLRLTPPAPKKILFPALALLKGLIAREETPARSPWWLLLLRLTIVALLIIAFAKPVLDPIASSGDTGTLLVAIDNDWATARDWPKRQNILHDIIQKAQHDKRSVAFIITSHDANDNAPSLTGPVAAESALNTIDHLKPEAWAADWAGATKALQNSGNISVHNVLWLTSGIGNTDARLFYDALQKIAPTQIYGTTTPIYTLTPPTMNDDALVMFVMRADTDAAGQAEVNAIGDNGNILAHWTAIFSEGSPRAMIKIDLPSELRNSVTRFEITTPHTAASTVLLDAAWQHHAVGITGDAAELDRHSLLSEIYYIDRALKPFADIHIDTLDGLVKANVPVIFMTDSSEISDTTMPALTTWIQHGGILVRFAGERFAGADNHDKEVSLLPVPLRFGNRTFGGALSWGTPQKLKSFPATSPFHNLNIPTDVTIARQILAEPSTDLATRTWASLEDGTPLVTATSIGQGMSILYHVPARSSWSNLPLSGLFVEMLQKILQLSRSDHATREANANTLRPISILNAYGDAHAPTASILPLQNDELATAIPSPQHPPGLYGTENNSSAFNLGSAIGQPERLRDVPIEPYAMHQHEIDIQPYLLLTAFLLLLLDFFISLNMRGFLRSAVILFGFLCCAIPAHATTDDKIAAELTSKPYLGYIRTGNSTVDRTSELGLRGLAIMLQRRTSLDDVGVARVNPDTDDLTFFPFLYWPMTADQNPLSAEGAKRITHYLRHGGLILFDAVNAENIAPQFLHHVLAGVDLPRVAPLPETHVLKRSFYLLESFPGRFADRGFWLETEDSSTYDGVASVLYGSNGWAEAWALDESGHTLYPCTPGGEDQREHAYRFGINLVIYALTGNYKNGQMSTAKILEKM